MKDLNQLLLEFDYKQNFKEDDFYVSKSNFYTYELINKWPKWEKNFLNISGERHSGKSHLVNIFLKKFQGYKIGSNLLTNDNLQEIKDHQNIILEDLNLNVNEELVYSLFNIIDQNNKFLVITSILPITELKFQLEDLRSRTNNCILGEIKNPDDELMFALILKSLSDRQIIIDKKLIDFIIKRVERSYSKIFDFIYKIDKISLKKKKSIDFKIIKEALQDYSE